MLCDWLVVGQVIATNPAAPVRGPRHVVRKGKTPVLTAEEATLLHSIPGDTVVGMRDRALIALMVYTFARVGAVIKMRSEDVYVQDGAPGCACTRKAASGTKCPAITRSIRISPSTSRRQASVTIRRAGCFAARGPARGSCTTADPSPSPTRSDDPPPRARRQASARRSAITRFGPPVSPSTCATAASSKSRSAWRIMSPREPPVCMTGGTIRCRWMRWSGY